MTSRETDKEGSRTIPFVHLAKDYPPLHPPSKTRCRLCHERRFVPGLTVRVRYRQGWEHEYKVCQECYQHALAAQETTPGPHVDPLSRTNGSSSTQ